MDLVTKKFCNWVGSMGGPLARAIGARWGNWVGYMSSLVEQLGLGGMTRQVALNCALVAREGHDFCLALEPGHAQLLTKTVEERLMAALERHFGGPVTLRFQIGDVTAATPASQRKERQAERRQAAAEQVNQDPHVRDMQATFGARFVAIHPLDETDG